MARLPQLKRFLKEDFTNAPDWLDKLFFPLNLFMNAVYGALNKGLTVNDNMLGQIVTYTVTGGAADPILQFNWAFVTKPVGCVIINAVDTSSTPAVITSAVTCAWSYSAGVISIHNITGLTAGKTYSVTFEVKGG